MEVPAIGNVGVGDTACAPPVCDSGYIETDITVDPVLSNPTWVNNSAGLAVTATAVDSELATDIAVVGPMAL